MTHVRVYRQMKYLANYDAKVFLPTEALRPLRAIKMYDTEWSIQQAIDEHIRQEEIASAKFHVKQIGYY